MELFNFKCFNICFASKSIIIWEYSICLRKKLLPSLIQFKKKSDNINDNQTRKLLDDMLETMYAAPGIGLAAVKWNIKKSQSNDVSKRMENPPF